MDNIILNVFVAGINKSYDIKISADTLVKTAADYIFKTISEYEELEVGECSCILCSRKQKKVLNCELTLRQSGIKDGNEIILI